MAVALAGMAALASVAGPAPSYRSLLPAFVAFADGSVTMPASERVAAFKARFGALFPAFYRARDGRSEADYDRMIGRSLAAFPVERAAIGRIAMSFPAIFAEELARFRRHFPHFRPAAPIYLVHSLGEMDAGTRVIGRRRVLIFGIDGIALFDAPDSLPMLLDHEFFHLVHGRAFPGCAAIWCTLWREGLAVYAASLLNPGASDRQLGLDDPGRKLRPAVEARRRDAICLLRARLDRSDAESRRLFFRSGGGTGSLPPRFGYYLGYRVALRAGQTRALAMLAALPARPARAVVNETLSALAEEAGGCA